MLRSCSRVGLGRHQGKGTARSKTRARSPGVAKMVNEWPKAGCVQLQSRKSDGQVETPWPGASRIEIEHPVNGLDPRPMRVAGRASSATGACAGTATTLSQAASHPA